MKLGPSLFDTLYSSLDLLRTAKLNEVRYTGKDEQITQFSNDCIRLFFESVQILGENLPFIPDLMLDFYLHSSKFYNGYFTLFLEENASLEEYLLLVTAIYAFEGRCLEKVYIGLSKDKFEEMLHEAIVKPHVPLLIGEFPRLLGNTNRLLGEPSDGSLAIADDFGGVCFKLLAKEGEKSIENMRRHYEEFVIQSTTLFLQRASEKYPRQECPHGGESCSSVLFIEHVLKEFKELKIKCEKHFEVFLSSLSKGFKVGLGRWSPFIGIFCDSLDALLTGASRDFDGAELDIFVENSGLLLRHIEDKESVMNIYGEKLSARLLHNKSTSITTEVALVEQWRRQCGPDFTQKLEKMIQDMEVSREEMSYFLANYHGSTATNDISWDSACNIPGRGFPFNVFLCSAGSWPFESHLALGVQKVSEYIL